jgi:glyoxylase-like metal-dependent hydrolase (beta-lactamase superfamily II)
MEQPGGVDRWTVGDVVIAKVHETTLDHEHITEVLPIETADLAPHREWMQPYLGPHDQMLMSVHAFCVEADGLRIVVDTCIGNDQRYGDHPSLRIFEGLHTDFLDDLAAVGFGRDDVDVVICTHLHPDHVGWNTVRVGDGWEPTFRRARYLMSRVDVEAWRVLVGAHNPWRFAIQPLVDHGCLDVVDAPHRVSPSVEIFATPGHTAGHVSVRITSGEALAVITGDMVHSPIQLVEPDWTYRYDTDAALAARSVRDLVDEVRDRGALVLGTHFPTPTAGELRSSADGIRFVAI